MLWILLALLGAVTNASYFIIIKRYIKTLDPKILTGFGFTCGGLLLFAFSAIRGFPVIGQDFYSAVAITAVLNIISLSLIFKALSSIGSLAFHSHALVYTGNIDRYFLSSLKRGPLFVRGCRHLYHRDRILCAEHFCGG